MFGGAFGAGDEKYLCVRRNKAAESKVISLGSKEVFECVDVRTC